MTEERKEAENVEKTAAEPDAKKMDTYRTVVLNAYGGLKQIRVGSIEKRAPRRNEIEIEVEACGINFLDIMLRQGLLERGLKPPFTMGSECCGIVRSIGEDITEYKVNDRVVIVTEHNAWAEVFYAPVMKPVLHAEGKVDSEENVRTMILPWPEKLSASQASIMPYAYLPAYFLVHHVACIKSGNVVLVHSAGGGVGSAILQLVKTLHDVKVIGIASEIKHEKVKSLCEHLFKPDQDYCAEIKKLYPNGVDIILDCLGGEDTNKMYPLLKPLGTYVLYGNSSLVTGERKNLISVAKNWFHTERLHPLRIQEENRIIAGFCLNSLVFNRANTNSFSELMVRQAWTALLKQIDEGSIDPWVDTEWGFEQYKEAMGRLHERKNIGKVVFLPKLKEKVDSSKSAE